ncbi:MAG: hypothetical protein IKP89_08455 [Bacteroidales bacterium]|nr:hypothetical protein [Bacteroidales bacterium]
MEQQKMKEMNLVEVEDDLTPEEILSDWKKQADNYRYDPDKNVRHYPLEHFIQSLKQAVLEQI